MYTIFVGDKPIILTTLVDKETDFKAFLLKSVDLSKVIRLLNTTDVKAVYLVGKNPKKLLKRFRAKDSHRHVRHINNSNQIKRHDM